MDKGLPKGRPLFTLKGKKMNGKTAKTIKRYASLYPGKTYEELKKIIKNLPWNEKAKALSEMRLDIKNAKKA